MTLYEKRPIVRMTEHESRTLDDEVALEVRLRILVNGKDLLSLYCSPSMIRELVTGLVATEGVIEGEWCADRMSIEYGEEIVVDIPAAGSVVEKGAIRTSGCVGGVSYVHDDSADMVDSGGTVARTVLIERFKEFQTISKPYQVTGCIHSAALADARRILVHAEDIGRHNAVDKLIGYSILESIPVTDKLLLVSGRLSSEIAYKCSRWKIPIVASRTAPTIRAVDIAQRAGVTLIGFLREKRMNIYCNPDRIL